MGFIARWNYPMDEPAVRVYLHNCGMEMYSKGNDILTPNIERFFGHRRDDFSGYDFVMVSLCGNVRDMQDEFHGFKYGRWPIIDAHDTWVEHNGILVKDAERCEDIDRMLEHEDIYRIEMRSLTDYVRSWPNMSNLSPPRTFNMPHVKLFK